MTSSPQDILRINSPNILFPNGRASYLKLVKEWHPDHNKLPEAAKVMAHITMLYERMFMNMLELVDKGITYQLQYLDTYSFELGQCYWGQQIIGYVLGEGFTDYYKRFPKSFSFADDAMKKEMVRFLPQEVTRYIDQYTRRPFVLLQKTPDVRPLRSLPRPIDPRHVAWMVSGLLNIACYLDWAKLSHNAINLNSVWVSTQHHSILLLGGWWHHLPYGEKYKILPRVSIPFHQRRNTHANGQLDLKLIRALGRELLGDRLEITPTPMRDFLRGMFDSRVDAFETYTRWQKVLVESFGERKFIPWVDS